MGFAWIWFFFFSLFGGVLLVILILYFCHTFGFGDLQLLIQ